MTRALAYLALAVVAYVSVSLLAYSFRHTHLTQTQVLFGIGDALCWKATP